MDRSTWRARPALSPGGRSIPRRPLGYRPNRPRPEIAARRLRVLYEDEHILIVDKPAGVSDPANDGARARHASRACRALLDAQPGSQAAVRRDRAPD